MPNDEETDNLLASVDGDRDEELFSRPLSSASESTPPTPLPWRPMMALFLLNVAQPLTFELIYPFINQMILEIGVVNSPERVGFYSGLIGSIANCMGFIAILPNSYISDRWGRKPVILTSITCLAILTALFGMSRSFWFMLVTRSVAGALGGIWQPSSIMLAELTDKSNQGAAFSGLNISYRLGQVISQPLAGFLVHPGSHWSLFQAQFWFDYPYLLPCLIATILAAIAVALGHAFLQETLASKRKRKTPLVDISIPTELQAPRAIHRPPFRSVLTRPVVSLLASTAGMAYSAETLFALYPLYAFTPIKSGGLGLSEAGIGTHLGLRSAICIITTIFYAPLQRRLGSARLYQLTMAMFPLTILLMPLLNNVAQREDQASWLLNVLLFVFFTLWSMAGLSWPGIGIMVNDAAPSADALAAINGLSQMAIALPQTIAPAAANSLFILSIESHVAGGNLIWIVMIGLSSIAALHSLTLKEAAHDWRKEYADAVGDAEYQMIGLKYPD